ncbi:MAG: hypothetical protein UX09_C0057G0003 [Candidatus Uhrbacteria bacterium GW2011_GWE2_45_35]|uniref:Uncharacterized protein n=2 Tax=Candidatus Uhriibacteriota TaxID=1752732 RepID=A0A0G1LN07_9BACT|nr:MAG: hypothetical protein UW63_C0036G0008 [Candidatus Uhrbacteria bacterium GW2011_GWF2_44_350]KKU06163.1 MAG: hypothetical protein UX09_C0057G0003 [Candidatus Uhrbacteria bacterium GW2011_GWE2_45_35]HBR80944.1 hypothetical protein [Candidatus Uhrbacteria bacterium]
MVPEEMSQIDQDKLAVLQNENIQIELLREQVKDRAELIEWWREKPEGSETSRFETLIRRPMSDNIKKIRDFLRGKFERNVAEKNHPKFTGFLKDAEDLLKKAREVNSKSPLSNEADVLAYALYEAEPAVHTILETLEKCFDDDRIPSEQNDYTATGSYIHSFGDTNRFTKPEDFNKSANEFLANLLDFYGQKMRIHAKYLAKPKR